MRCTKSSDINHLADLTDFLVGLVTSLNNLFSLNEFKVDFISKFEVDVHLNDFQKNLVLNSMYLKTCSNLIHFLMSSWYVQSRIGTRQVAAIF